MLDCQRDQFFLPEDIAYLNCAYMAPNLRSVEEVGIQSLKHKNHPYQIQKTDFFEPVAELRSLFAQIIGEKDADRIAIIPSVSYGIATVARNIKPKVQGNIVVAAEQFPSNFYAWKRLADTFDLQIRTVRPDDVTQKRGSNWNERLLESIDGGTVLVAIANAHWADGTLFDLEAIRAVTLAHQAYLIIDGTQSIGAMPFRMQQVEPDAIICAGYKWLLGPYSLGLAYFSERFDSGIPIEENWINRWGSDDFQGLVNYEDRYLPKAHRYSVGESSNFILVPMLVTALRQILTWGIENIQDYAGHLVRKPIEELEAMGAIIEKPEFRAKHLFGVRLGNRWEVDKLQAAFAQNQVFISMRGQSVRVSTHVYNTAADFEKLIKSFAEARTAKPMLTT
jgi:selenocysteine lyase/cysteine desulfurase